MATRITVDRAVAKRDVTLYDHTKDAHRKYRLRPVTRSVQRAIAEMQEHIGRVAEERKAHEGPASADQLMDWETQETRIFCDLLNEALDPTNDDTPPGGDLLYAGWEADQVDPSEIGMVVNEVLGADKDPS